MLLFEEGERRKCMEKGGGRKEGKSRRVEDGG